MSSLPDLQMTASIGSSLSVVILEEIKEGLLSAVKEGTGPGKESGSVTFQESCG